MRLDEITLNLVRLPLVRPFQTSSSRKDHLDHILVRVDADGGDGLGRVRQPVRSVLLPRDDRDLLAHPPRFPGPAGAGQRLVDHRRAGRLLPPRQGEQLRQGRAGDGLLGRCWHGARTTAALRCSAARGPRSSRASAWASRPTSSRSSTRSTSISTKAIAGSSSRSRRDGTSTSSGGSASAIRDLPLQVDANSAYTLDDLPTLQAARRLRPAPDRAAAGARRHHRPRPAPGRARRRRSASTRASTRPTTRARRSTWAPAG